MERTARDAVLSTQPACMRCRKHKLRCTRERPFCSRCQRLKAECLYPPPPNRKLIAAQRSNNSTSSSNATRVTPVSDGSPQAPLLPTVPIVKRSQGTALLNTDAQDDQGGNQFSDKLSVSPPDLGRKPPANLSKEVALFLIEIYFERHYQAHLLLDKDTFVGNYLANNVSDSLAMSVFAFAALFLTSDTSRSVPKEIAISNIAYADWDTIGEQWAEYASQKTLMSADKPCLEHVQVCQIIAMFWFSKSQTQRTHIHTTIAYRTARLLQLYQVPQSISKDSEQGLRCYWACWLTKCASLENAHFDGDCWKDVAGVPAPIDHTRPTPIRHCVDEHGQLSGGGGQGPNQPPRIGLYVALIMAYGIWWEVQRFVKQSPKDDADPSSILSQLHAIDEKLEDYRDLISAEYNYPLNLEAAPTVDFYAAFSLNYLYHMCCCYLHSSIVPVFSRRPRVSKLSRKILRLSAEQAIAHSARITDITNHFLSQQPDVSKLWPVIGYGAFVCSSVQLRYSIASNALSALQIERLRVHFHLLDGLKRYWAPLQQTYANMESQFTQAQRLPLYQPGYQPNAGEQSDLDRVMATDGSEPSPLPVQDIYTYVPDEEKPATTSTTQSPAVNSDVAVHSATSASAYPGEAEEQHLPPPVQHQHQHQHQPQMANRQHEVQPIRNIYPQAEVRYDNNQNSHLIERHLLPLDPMSNMGNSWWDLDPTRFETEGEEMEFFF